MKVEEEMRKIIFFTIGILLLIYLAACSDTIRDKSTLETPSTATATRVEIPTVTENENWVIFTKEAAEEMGVASWLVEGDQFWSPSENDILTLEEKLPEYLFQNAYLFIQQPPAWERLDEYQRQYIGFFCSGQKIIYGNFFCDPLNVNWLENIVSVDDGGECYFQFEFNVDEGTFIFLLVNGVS